VQLGADPDLIGSAMLETWNEKLTVFTKGTEYKGKDNILSVVIDGERRFFEASPNLYKLLQNLNKEALFGGILGQISRTAVGLQRLGATGLNPAFGLIRNALRDTGTTAITSDYAKGGPLASLAGIVEDVVGSEMATRYHAMGVDLAGWIGQSKRNVRGLARKATAGTTGRRVFVTVTSPIQALRAVFGVTEAGPRLAEFKAAFKYAKDKGMSNKSASILATVAAKDVSVNFSRAGEYGRIMNGVVIFFNATIQSVDKFGRTFYKHPVRTLVRGAAWLTLASMMAYYRNRDEDWWKELPEYEKWQYVHWKLPGGTILRIPLPFEFGIVFGSLPVSAIEETRTPGAFKEALNQLRKATVDGDKLMPSMLSPFRDIWRNEDWKGADIVPVNIKRSRLPEDQYTTQTTELAKTAGKMLGVSPAQLEHIVNAYSGGLYRRTYQMINSIKDPSGIGADGDMSTLPVVGTLFLRRGTSRVAGDFYDRLDDLRQKKGSGQASVSEIGELSEKETLARQLGDLWQLRREAIGSDKTADQIKVEAEKIQNEVNEMIRKHNDQSKSDYSQTGAGSLLYAATSSKASDDDQAQAISLLQGMRPEDQIKALQAAVKRRGGSTKVRTSTGKLTAYGERLARLKQLDNQD
jgi:hypothetical protein